MPEQVRRVRPPERPQYGAVPTRTRPRGGAGALGRLSLPEEVRWRWVILAVALLVLVAVVRQAFQIEEIKVGKGIEGEQIPNTVRGLIAQDFRQGSTLTLDTERLKGELLKEKPQLKSVEIQRSGLKTLTITGSLKRPALGWSSAGQNYLLDRSGTAIGALPSDASVPVVIDSSNLPVRPGDQVSSPRFIDFAAGVPEALAGIGIKTTSLRIQETTFDLWAQTDRGYRITLDTGRTLEEQVEDLKLVLASLRKQGKTPSEYIDLRVAGKAYYK